MDLTEAPPRPYEGNELELFSHPRNWKAYWSGHLARYVRGAVLDVGAGLGETAKLLASGADRWVCLEPDEAMAQDISERIEAGVLPPVCEVRIGVIDSVAERDFSAIVYIDVLVHIEHDAAELVKAAERLAPGGHLVVLAPAHQFLFSPFDKAIGHYRRYTLAMMRALTPPGLVVEDAYYLDSVGLLASLANSMIMKSAMPTASQIGLWDRAMVPASRLIDRLHGRRLGKTCVTVWRKV